MLKPEYVNGKRVRIVTGHKTFDKQCHLLSTGNVNSDVQRSAFIRAFHDTECNGLKWKEGHLRDNDIGFFGDLPSNVLDCVMDETMEHQIILYEIRHHHNHRLIVHGWIVTHDHHKNHALIKVIYARWSITSINIMDTAVKWVSNEEISMPDWEFSRLSESVVFNLMGAA